MGSPESDLVPLSGSNHRGGKGSRIGLRDISNIMLINWHWSELISVWVVPSPLDGRI